jgi:hypothetical protein
MEKKKLLSLLSSVAGNTASYIYLLDGQPQWRTTSSSVYISIACSSCRLGLSGPNWLALDFNWLFVSADRTLQGLPALSTAHLHQALGMKGVVAVHLSWAGKVAQRVPQFDPIRSYSILSCRRNLRERWMKIRFTNFTVTPRNFFWLRLFSNTIPCENTCWSCCRDLTCPHIHTISYHDNDASSI